MANITLVDDDENIVASVSLALESHGHTVTACHDGVAGLEALTSSPPDLAILDVKMPVLDGLTAAEQIAGLGTTAVVMLTAFSQPELVERANGAGVMAFLVKPVDPSDLRSAIEVARSRFAEKVSLTAELGDLADKLAARKAIERAKGILQSKYGMDEGASFRWLQKAAMDGRMSMDAVATVVIAESEKSGD